MEFLINTLKKAGYKITTGRKSVLDYLFKAGKPVSLKDIRTKYRILILQAFTEL
jgi:Fe2+ or Zn2+ uptake regulation protein